MRERVKNWNTEFEVNGMKTLQGSYQTVNSFCVSVCVCVWVWYVAELTVRYVQDQPALCVTVMDGVAEWHSFSTAIHPIYITSQGQGQK